MKCLEKPSKRGWNSRSRAQNFGSHLERLGSNVRHRLGTFADGGHRKRTFPSVSNRFAKFTSNVAQSTENKDTTMAVFLDLSKALDTIDHNILLDKLSYYGLGEITSLIGLNLYHIKATTLDSKMSLVVFHRAVF